MGRTIPSFRIALAMEKEEWKPFRNALDKSDRKSLMRCGIFLDGTFQLAPILFNVRLHMILMSLLLYNYKQLT
ncbi:MAG TPA: hypothetical protein VFZ67_09690 [Nitrososphaera sp.]|jgi:hypothetical protein